MKRFILLVGVVSFLGNLSFAQEDRTVTLTVSGQGQTQDEAKQNALRSAIEQAFGTFISSNTEILNDELVKDEIVSVSNGNIQNFEILSEVQIPNGNYATTLKATVSVNKLTSFVESKGVTAEFKGSILAANVKQQMLNEQNETKSIENISIVCKQILDLSCDFSIVSGEPKQVNNNNNNWSIPIRVNVRFNKNIEQFNQYLLSSIKGLAMSTDEVIQYRQLGKKTYRLVLGKTGGVSGEKYYDNTDRKYWRSLAASNPNLHFIIVGNIGGSSTRNYQFDRVLFESDKIKEILNYCERNRSIKKIQFYDKTLPNSIYHFRNMSTITSIIDLIYYSKHSLLNFEIANGINTNTPEQIIERKNPKDNIEIGENFHPIFNSGGGRFGNSVNFPRSIFYEYNLYDDVLVFSIMFSCIK